MAVYLLAFISTIFLMYIFWKRKTLVNVGIKVKNTSRGFWNNQLRILIVVFPLWFISAFRYDVGTDYFYTYVRFYFDEKNYGWKPYTEPLFQLLNTCIVNLGLNYVWIFIISSFIILYCVFNLIYKYSNNPILSFIVFFVSGTFFCTLNNVRQYIATFIALYSFYQRDAIKSIIIILIASMFHTAALLFLPILICSKVPIGKRNLVLLSLLSLPFSYLVLSVLNIVIKNSKYSYFNEFGGYSLLLILVNLLLYFLCLFYYQDKDKNTEFGMLVKVQFCAVIFCIVSVMMQNEELWVRVIRMPAALQMFLVPRLIRKEKDKECQMILIVALLLMFSVYTIYTFYLMGGLEVFPYKFYFINR